MRLEVFGVCRRPPAWVREATLDYARRLRREFELSFAYVAPGQDRVSTPERQRDEAERLCKRMRPGSHLVVLDGTGTEGDSGEVAAWLGAWREAGRDVTLLIGGADGLAADLLARAGQRWSLSRLTLPHLLVQLLVAEQIYRAWSILSGHPYHRA